MESALRFLRAPPDGRLPDELVGWCVGVAMFSDEEFILAKTLMRQPSRLDRYVRTFRGAVKALALGRGKARIIRDD